MGQREGISFKDAKMINLRYCRDKCRKLLPCANNGYTDPNDCRKCRCPRGFGGTYCTEVEQTSCGGEVSATCELQTLISGPVNANSKCIWRIKSPFGEKLELIMDLVSFPCSDVCNSYVEVKTTKSKIATGARLCCDIVSPFYSEGDDIIVIFRGDPELRSGYLGFVARYRHLGSVVNTKHPSTIIITSTATPLLSTQETTKPVNRATWGLWGEWSLCSQSCGNGGQRRRIRGCYKGNKRCPGHASQAEACNLEPCTNALKANLTCYGRLLLPCDLLQKLVFGQKARTFGHLRTSPLIVLSSKRPLNESISSSPSRNIVRSPRITRSTYGFCEKRFIYTCPTEFLTVHIDWKENNLRSNKST